MKPKIKEYNFNQMLDQALKEDQYKGPLEEIKKDYQDYKNFFDQVFIADKPLADVYRFRANYLRSEKRIWREIEILGDQTFQDLAMTIIEAMAWDDDHLHGFSFPPKAKSKAKTTRPNHSDFQYSKFSFLDKSGQDDSHPTYKTNQIRIANLDYRQYSRLQFEFDYGEGHIFFVDFLTKRERDKSEKKTLFPRVVAKFGKAPEQYSDIDHQDLTEQQAELAAKLPAPVREQLWGEIGPYSQVQVVQEIRIIDIDVSRIFLIVSANINPTTYQIVKDNKKNFKKEPLVKYIIDNAVYEELAFGYSVVFLSEQLEEGNNKQIKSALKMAEIASATIIMMHDYVMQKLGIDPTSFED